MLYYGLYICSYTTSIRTKLKLNFQNLAAFSHIFVAVITAFNVPLLLLLLFHIIVVFAYLGFHLNQKSRKDHRDSLFMLIYFDAAD